MNFLGNLGSKLLSAMSSLQIVLVLAIFLLVAAYSALVSALLILMLPCEGETLKSRLLTLPKAPEVMFWSLLLSGTNREPMDYTKLTNALFVLFNIAGWLLTSISLWKLMS